MSSCLLANLYDAFKKTHENLDESNRIIAACNLSVYLPKSIKPKSLKDKKVSLDKLSRSDIKINPDPIIRLWAFTRILMNNHYRFSL